jgi:hypothetical protein
MCTVTVGALPKICTAFYNWKSRVMYLNTTRVFIEGISGGIVNILECSSMDYFE